MEKSRQFQPVEVEKQENEGSFASEIWFREADKGQIENCSIVTTVRSGDRTATTTDPKGGYREGCPVTLKILKENGHFDAVEVSAIVSAVRKLRLGDLEERYLERGADGVNTKTELLTKLQMVYGRAFCDDDTVTIISFEYKKT
ncbi:MAG: hypothetical protein COV10_04295 [Candidatus Vogelbacteria bacterium CG10_big_fil_rev_8_21_14_0_10_51_16]|uniref:ASCH domain-containing protein n=1 Tax=Candidatus Vogelbacteria bacterium CG10_big_fil_rev_8_21_14_0_10_51_16 TaxID=1975045 RepID=A0A2H0RDG0_9BACT|nr:MAG: hypothetical protein COV10_04295 [Candidatus Vogelbacteria bacterium CG10_big_fil_rev_8_21_14_0_10_51_16]